MANFFQKIFKKKEGGTLVGNILRTAKSVAAPALSLVPLPGAGLVSNLLSKAQNINGGNGLLGGLLPKATLPVNQIANQLVQTAIAQPDTTYDEALVQGAEAKEVILQTGGSEAEASATAQKVVAAAQLPAMSNSLTGQDLRNIGTAIIKGAKDGATDGYLETEDGKQMKREMVDQQGTKMMPYILLGGIALLFLTQANRNN